MGEDAIYDLVLAVDEAVTNIFVHGYKNQQGFLEITMHSKITVWRFACEMRLSPSIPRKCLHPLSLPS